jgi:hypothetical protein
MSNRIEFRDVQIGQRVRFKASRVIYTRVPHLDENGKKVLSDGLEDRTLTYTDHLGRTVNAYCNHKSKTLVTIVEDNT